MSRIIALPSIKVKPTRIGSRRPGRFGAGLLRSLPAVRDNSHSARDDAWLAAQSAGPDFGQLAAEAAAMSRLEVGLCC